MKSLKLRWVVSVVIVAGTIGFFAGAGFTEDPEPSEEQMAEMMKMFEELAKPGPGHERLDPMVGDFDVVSKAWMAGPEPTVTKASAKCEWVLGGRYVQITYNGSFMDKPFEGRGVMGFDNFKKEYQSIWYDSMSSNIMTSTGSANDDGKTLTFNGTWEGPMGKMNMKHVYQIESNDKYVLTGYMSTPEGDQKHMELTFTRKKAAAPAARANPRCCPKPTTKGPGY